MFAVLPQNMAQSGRGGGLAVLVAKGNTSFEHGLKHMFESLIETTYKAIVISGDACIVLD